MSIHSWLRNLRSALAPGRRHHRHGRRSPLRAATHRLNIEALEDRSVPAFLSPVNYTISGAYLTDMVAADFNNDTMQDLAVVDSWNSTLNVLLGNGDGTFDAPLISVTGAFPHSLAVGDFDGDGNSDLAMATDLDVKILLGDGAGRFTPAGGIYRGDLGTTPQSVAVGDFNGDGLLDLGVTSYFYFGANRYADVLLGNGDGSFSPGYSEWLGQGIDGRFAATAADLNGDGFDDLATVTASGNACVHVLLSNASGGLQSRSTYSIGGYESLDDNRFSLAAGDLDKDGDTDLILGNVYGLFEPIGVLLGDGAGNLSASGPYFSGAVVLGDFTGDGNLDVAAATDNGVNLYRGEGNGAFRPVENFAANSYPYGAAAADFNGDGWLDVATVTYGGGSVLINDQSWPFVPPTVSVNDASVTEGNNGTAKATFTLTLSHASPVDVTVHYATAGITATAGSDYSAASGDVIIPAGRTSATFSVAVIGDRLAEPNETFVVNLSGATNATIGDSQGTGTIVDDEPRISISDVTKSEGRKNKSTSFTFTITLSAAYDQAVTVSYRTVDGTAKASDGDYVAKSGTITFAPGETTKTITITVKGDSRKESNETFYLDLFGNSSNSLITKSHGIGAILNDD